MSEDRFSTAYKTKEEFTKDRLMIMERITDDLSIPQDIFEKVAATVKELNLQFGE